MPRCLFIYEKARMVRCYAKEYDCVIRRAGVPVGIPYSFLRDEAGDKEMWLVGPEHGRSYLVGREPDGRFVISKGNGLSYTLYPFINTGEMGVDSWGLLLKKDAERDFQLGQEIASLGIKTNKMQYVLEIDCPLIVHREELKPYLLQYSVECPYRITDAAFIPRKTIEEQVARWPRKYEYRYLDAAEVLIKNLYILHKNRVLHNAITPQNYTWALELLDFELASSPRIPYDRDDYQRHVQVLMSREIIHTYQIIIYIAAVLGECRDDRILDAMFKSYGFDIEIFAIHSK